ncbi:hypothetical protein [Nostoc sp.]|uniref:hypothetical protein n=1 Tax=Nostoc sp. TaxID=1180 RepID=UPI002FF8510A
MVELFLKAMSVLKSNAPADARSSLRDARGLALRDANGVSRRKKRQLLKSGNAKSKQVGKPQGRTGSTFCSDGLYLPTNST